MKNFARTLFMFLVFLPSFALGASITGNVYDLDLESVTSAIVTIDTQPEQRVVAKEGTYTFTVPAGSYTLTAQALTDGELSSTTEELTVAEDGTYTVDLILFPDFSDVDEFELKEEVPEVPLEQDSPWLYIALIVIAVVALVGVFLFFRRVTDIEDEEEDDEFAAQVLALLKKHDGRMTQKQLRKELPFSEAKVSLIITELEESGEIQKIKKGRGNIIVLK